MGIETALTVGTAALTTSTYAYPVALPQVKHPGKLGGLAAADAVIDKMDARVLRLARDLANPNKTVTVDADGCIVTKELCGTWNGKPFCTPIERTCYEADASIPKRKLAVGLIGGAFAVFGTAKLVVIGWICYAKPPKPDTPAPAVAAQETALPVAAIELVSGQNDQSEAAPQETQTTQTTV